MNSIMAIHDNNRILKALCRQSKNCPEYFICPQYDVIMGQILDNMCTTFYGKVPIYYSHKRFIEETEPDTYNKFDIIIKDNKDTVIEIELKDLKELFDNAILQDDVEYTLTEDSTKTVDAFSVAIKRFSSNRVNHNINEFNQKAMSNSKKIFTPIQMSPEGLEAIEMISLDCTNTEINAPWHSDSEIKIEKDGTITINGRKTSDFWDGKIHADTNPLRLKIRNICGDETIIDYNP